MKEELSAYGQGGRSNLQQEVHHQHALPASLQDGPDTVKIRQYPLTGFGIGRRAAQVLQAHRQARQARLPRAEQEKEGRKEGEEKEGKKQEGRNEE